MEVPAATPVTTPVPEPAVAIAVLPLLQVPPGVALLTVTAPPEAQIGVMPEIAAGAGSTVTVRMVLQPELMVYVIVVVPANTPLTIPEVRPIVAMDVEALVQVPPPGLVSEAVPLSQTVGVPDMAGSAGLTVSVIVDLHEPPREYVMEAVPAAMPVATPVVISIVATTVLPLVHVPPGTELLNDVAEPIQVVANPPIGPGADDTVTVAVDIQPVENTL